jgi:sec-independent protein translocase protein TatA
MGLENPVHLIFIGVVALLVLGPKRLPELARALGHGLREFREAVSMQGETEQGPVLPAEPPSASPSPGSVSSASPPLPAATVEDTGPSQG